MDNKYGRENYATEMLGKLISEKADEKTKELSDTIKQQKSTFRKLYSLLKKSKSDSKEILEAMKILKENIE
jgi:hypothetical protein